MNEQNEKQAIAEMANILEQAKIDAHATIGSMNYGFGMWYAKACYNAGYRKQEWISVEERLPGVSGRYICAVKDKNGHTWTVAGDYSLEMKKWFGLLFGEIKNTVTHWMPLPEPPKMKGGAE